MKLTSPDGYRPVGDPLCFERKKDATDTMVSHVAITRVEKVVQLIRVTL